MPNYGIGQRVTYVDHGTGGFPSTAPYIGFKFFRDDLGVLYYATVKGTITSSQWLPDQSTTAHASSFPTSPYVGQRLYRDDVDCTYVYSGSTYGWQLVGPVGKNYLINANMEINQRYGPGSGTTGIVNGSFCTDRWKHIRDGTGGATTFFHQAFTPGQTFVPYESTYYLRLSQTATGTSQTFWGIGQYIEDVHTLAGQPFSVSFWLRTSVACTIISRIDQAFGTGGSASVGGTSGNFTTTANTWQYWTFNASLASISGKTIGAGSFLAFYIYTTTIAVATFDVSQPQLEYGAANSIFPAVRRNFDEELRLCMRYYQKSFPYSTAVAQNAGVLGAYACPTVTAGAVTSYGPYRPYAVPMRQGASPTYTTYNPSAANAQARNSLSGTSNDASTTTVNGLTSETGIAFNIVGQSTWGAGQRADVHYTVDAEL